MPLPPLENSGSKLYRALAWIRGAAITTILLSALICMNFLQMLSVIIAPFAPYKFRAVNRWVGKTWWGWCHTWANVLYGIDIVYSGDDPPMKEKAILVINHQQMTDVPLLWDFARKKGRLPDMKGIAKDIIKYIPGPGWGMLFLDMLYVKRDWMKDQKNIHKVYSNILKYDIPLWLFSYVEGGRLRPGRLKAAQEYAEKIGARPPRHVLIPRTKGFVVSVEQLRGHIDAVYDVTVGYVGGVPSLWQWICGYVREVHIHVRRFEVGTLPTESDAIAKWLIKVFEEKDDLLEYYYNNGVFPAGGTA